ncbi:MAG TPA: polymer-forming cytoskeletal protein [Candidatus Saccharimonadales bacterium]|nr:polymer-forming cytoskeletal protein [Candidatus Saccharimonadales bacterium]
MENQNQTPQPVPTESLENQETQPPVTSGPALGSTGSTSPSSPPARNSSAEELVKPSIVTRLRGFLNIYFLIFIAVFIAAVVGLFFVLHGGKKSSSNTKTTSLTTKEISQLQGSTTIVGDAKQNLDVQSNTLFEGQVLLKDDLNVAGNIKVGGNLTLPTLTVGNTGSFGQLQVNNTLSVSGNLTTGGQASIQKGLTVAGNGSFSGNLSANQLTISSLQLNSDLAVSHHIVTSGNAPSKSDGSNLGSGGTVSMSGTDTAGTVTINTGGGPSSGCFVSVNFGHSFSTTPRVIISPANSSAAGLDYYTNRSANSFSICTTSTPTASSTFVFDYIVIQ